MTKRERRYAAVRKLMKKSGCTATHIYQTAFALDKWRENIKRESDKLFIELLFPELS